MSNLFRGTLVGLKSLSLFHYTDFSLGQNVTPAPPSKRARSDSPEIVPAKKSRPLSGNESTLTKLGSESNSESPSKTKLSLARLKGHSPQQLAIIKCAKGYYRKDCLFVLPYPSASERLELASKVYGSASEKLRANASDPPDHQILMLVSLFC
jgi:hypothetical protein